ncbi:MAG TPA: TadG family pilus assembly protein [Phycisphaerae bacterium]|nr:hypothetical protein [Phycisphaerae bacterium]HOB74710.1 TadG family pilus assembly protein [Phycisphaerae bacterium]HOJ56550.1 TadG family pilus assembly protein [Phycisphaerae bacterium]HOL25245.1 TadG family pilus assembly protein [Phycisphaerae bacterium]HPP22759.1 TadG family pilus assembly protein [Phycisphaerae bacterium]
MFTSLFASSTCRQRDPLRNSTRRRAVALVWVAILGLILIGMVGLALDAGVVVLSRQQLQNAADAAALAGAAKVKLDTDEARTNAVTIGLANKVLGTQVRLDRNDANAAEGDIVLGRYREDTGEFTPQTTAVNAVKVVARRTGAVSDGPVSLVFGPLFGVDTVDLSATAIAMVGGGTGAGLITLNPDAECALYVHGNLTLSVEDLQLGVPGAIQVNSSHSCAVCSDGNVHIEAGEINVHGGDCLKNANYAGTVNPGAGVVQDPLAGIPEPSPAGLTPLPIVELSQGDVRTIDPGYYAGGISMTGGTLTCTPGIYILDGVGLNVNGGDLIAHGVMFYIMDSTPDGKQPFSHVDLSGNGRIVITAIDLDDPSVTYPPGIDSSYEGMAIFQSRATYNLDPKYTAKIVGNNELNTIQGTLYFPQNKVNIGGAGGNTGTQLIADTVEVGGNGFIHIQYDGRNQAPGTKPFLVK